VAQVKDVARRARLVEHAVGRGLERHPLTEQAARVLVAL
jgi:hypothetical protein